MFMTHYGGIIFFISAVNALKLHGVAPTKPADLYGVGVGVVFNAAFKMLDESMSGSCHHLTPEDYENHIGYYSIPVDNATLPAFGAKPENTGDLQKVLAFAQTFGLKVNLKENGHSTFGASAAAVPGNGSSTLIIWMVNFNTIEVHPEGFSDTCGVRSNAAIKVGGGTRFGEQYEALKKFNYTFIGGTCDSVSGGGGFILGTGLSFHAQRKLGLGIDVVLQFDVMLSTGLIVTVDRCSHAGLFKALRGGGGGFAITLHVWMPLFPGSQVQNYDFYFSKKALVNATTWWELIVKHAPIADERWAMNIDHFSYADHALFVHGDGKANIHPDSLHVILTFLGSEEEAASFAILEDFTNLHKQISPNSRTLQHNKYARYIDFKVSRDGAWYTHAMKEAWLNFEYAQPAPSGDWPLPMKFLIEHPGEAAILLEKISEDKECNGRTAYQFGGVLLQNKGKSNEVVANPNIYDAGFHLVICTKQYFLELVHKFPDGVHELNHMAYDEDEPRHLTETIWGRGNYEYMLQIKQLYDPRNVFGCRYCVAWPPHLASYRYAIQNPMYMSV